MRVVLRHQNIRLSALCSPLPRYFSSSCVVHAQRANYPLDMSAFPVDLIRNFSIIAHIDHGKSTLADRLLELTGTIAVKNGLNKQVLDKLKVERERGITVKAQTASMIHASCGKQYLLNLIDTPGHVDFAWEVSRSLAACQGALLLVDASQGVQAQSISVFHVAKERGLRIIPVLNKIDLPAARPDEVAAQMETAFGINSSEILHVSAKSGKGTSALLGEASVFAAPLRALSSAHVGSFPVPEAIIDRVPPPKGDINGVLTAFLFDSSYDRYRGVISLVNVTSGQLRKGDKIASCYTRKKYEVTEVGIMHPEQEVTDVLNAGQVGYIACNMKNSSEAYVGDTLYKSGESVKPLPGFTQSKAMVYAGVFPIDSNDFPKLEESIKRLTLTDRSVTVQRESSAALGQGLRLGFLGTLHLDVFRQRLEDEYEARIIITAPTVPYKVVYHDRTEFISNPANFPDQADATCKVVEVQEPVVNASIIVPEEYLGEMMDLCYSRRATNLNHRYLDSASTSARVILSCQFPLSEIVTDFFSLLKSRSSGYASFDYEDAGYQRSDLSKLVFLLNSKQVDALALIVHRSAEQAVGRAWVKKLHKVIPRQLFEVPIQAAVGKRIVARETLSANRADVTEGLYGGHYERKMKHLENQKESKRRMKKIGCVELPQEAFFDILSTKQGR